MFVVCLGLVLSLGLLGSSSLGFWPSDTPGGIALGEIGGEKAKATPSHRHPRREWTEIITATLQPAAVETGPKKSPTDDRVAESAAAGGEAQGVTTAAPPPAPAPVAAPPGHQRHETRVDRADVKTKGKKVKTGRARGRVPGANPGHGGTPPGKALGQQAH
jgi:hypothetical protein